MDVGVDGYDASVTLLSKEQQLRQAEKVGNVSASNQF